MSKKGFAAMGWIVIALITVSCTKSPDTAQERATIEKTISDGIGWAVNKDFDLMHSLFACDEHLLIVNPDSSLVVGCEQFRELEDFFGDPRFKALYHEMRDLKYTISQSGTVVWYYCELDDVCEWNGRRCGWIGVRWTGVLEKRGGRWVHVQQHFSYPK